MIDKKGNETKTIYEAHLLRENEKLIKSMEDIIKVGSTKNGTNGTIYAHATKLIDIAQHALQGVLERNS